MTSRNMTFLPVSINITDREIVVIGGGRVASHKTSFLSQFTKNIVVVAPEISDNIKSGGYTCREKLYEKSDLDGAFLVYACTNHDELNSRIKAEAATLGILVNVADNPGLCDFVSPAVYKHENLTVAVGSNAQDVRRAIAVRDKIKIHLENDAEFIQR